MKSDNGCCLIEMRERTGLVSILRGLEGLLSSPTTGEVGHCRRPADQSAVRPVMVHIWPLLCGVTCEGRVGGWVNGIVHRMSSVLIFESI